MNREIKVCAVLAVVLMICLLSSCGIKAKTEKDVVADLQASRWFISEDLEIKSYEITKRQTDVENKKDVIYVTVHTNETGMICDLSYVMEYVLYNDGWVLEVVEKDEEGVWSIEGLSQEQLTKDIIARDDFYNTWGLIITNCNIEKEVYIYNNGQYEKQYIIAVRAEQEKFCYEATYMLSYRITESGWESGTFIQESSGCWPVVSLDKSMSDTIVDGLTMKYGATIIDYDGYKYLDTVTDWGNCAETHRYLAWKDWFYGRETYLISIPFSFSLGNGTPGWTYTKNAIEIELYDMDWNIAGTWRNKYEPASGNGYMTVKLNIDNVAETEDPEVYYASVSCDARSERWESYRCQTNGAIQARMKYSDPGTWFLYIDDSDGSQDSFTIRGYSAGVQEQGFFWRYSTLTSFTYCELKK